MSLSIKTKRPANNRTNTLFVSATEMMSMVSRAGLASTIRRIASRIESDYRRWPEFDKKARIASDCPTGTIELMPVADAQHFAFKYVNGHPDNTESDIATVMAFGVLADVATGAPRFLSELTLTTAIRTAAMSALAARRLARADSRSMAIIGNGAQSEFQALAFRELLGIHELRLYDRDPRAIEKLARNLANESFTLVRCDSIAQAVQGADIVTTITADKSNAIILTPDMIEQGMHINAVGGDYPGKTELHPAILLRADARVFVEYEPQTRIEGEIQQMAPDFPVVEFWRLLDPAQITPGRLSDTDVTIFDSVGFALEDFSALCEMQAMAQAFGMGRLIDLVPQAADPKDLFGELMATGSAASPARIRQTDEPMLAPAC